MSVLIKMPMPESCESCSFYGIEIDRGCYVKKFYVVRMKDESRPSWCPLIEIKPHGRLIDADELEKTMKNVAKSEWNIKAGVSTGIWCGIDMLEDAMTIIEAEVEE